MLTKNIKFKNFLKKFKNQKVKKDFKLFIKKSFLEKNHLLSSLTEKYNYTYNKACCCFFQTREIEFLQVGSYSPAKLPLL